MENNCLTIKEAVKKCEKRIENRKEYRSLVRKANELSVKYKMNQENAYKRFKKL